MTDLRQTIAPKSDQLNADDLIGATKTIRVTKVSLCGEADQPIAIGFEGDNSKPYKPCKSMRRVLVNVWGSDGNAFVGRSMTLYRDDTVTFGGLAVGGIRISHMTNIDRPVTMALTASKTNRKPFTVRPLVVSDPAPAIADTLRSAATDAAANGTVALKAFWDGISADDKKLLRDGWSAIKAAAEGVDASRSVEADAERQPGEEG